MMIRLAMILGLIALFGVGYSGVEKLALGDARTHAARGARTSAHLAAVVAELGWATSVEQLRGVAQGSATELAKRWPAGDGDPDPDVLRAQLQSIVDRSGGRGTAALFGADRRKIASVAPAGGSEIDSAIRPVDDARAGALTVQLLGGAIAPMLVAAAPIGGERVLAVSMPLDRRALADWLAGEEGSQVAVVGAGGELIVSTVDGGLPARVPKDVTTLDVQEKPHAASSRALSDDTGAVGSVVGLGALDVDSAAATVSRLRTVYGMLALVAIATALLGSFAPGRRRAGNEDEDADEEREPTQIGPSPRSSPSADAAWDALASDQSSRSVGADNLRAAARVLEGGDNSLPAVRHSEQINPANLPPLRYNAAPAPEPVSSVPAPSNTARAPSWNAPPPPAASRIPGMSTSSSVRPRPVSSNPNNSLAPGTFGRGMSPAPPAVATGAAPYPQPGVRSGVTPAAPFLNNPPASAGNYAPSGTFAGYTPLPMLDEDPDYLAATRASQLAPAPAPATMPGVRASRQDSLPSAPSTQGPRPFDEEHYRASFDEFIGSKRRLGESVESVSFEGFKAKLRKIEQTLIDKHACRAVRFQVIVKDKQVSLRPQLVR